MSPDLAEKLRLFVSEHMRNADAGHDLFHVLRVVKNAEKILRTEKADADTVLLAAWLHDIADAKFHNGNEELGPRLADAFMRENGIDAERRRHVVKIIRYMSFKNSFGHQSFHSPELHIVRDADRLDAIGAIGIARAFHFGGFKNNPIYDPDAPLEPVSDASEYKKYNRSTIHHFYDKLLKLKNMMHTPTARKMAEERHAFMMAFLERFFVEWDI